MKPRISTSTVYGVAQFFDAQVTVLLVLLLACCDCDCVTYIRYHALKILLAHGQVTIIFVVSVCLSVCLCRVSLSRL